MISWTQPKQTIAYELNEIEQSRYSNTYTEKAVEIQALERRAEGEIERQRENKEQMYRPFGNQLQSPYSAQSEGLTQLG